MPLSIPEIKEILKERKGSARHQLSKAALHEERIRLHTEATLSRNDSNAAITLLLNKVEERLPPEKFNMFLALFGFPVCTIPLTEQIFQSKEKIFDGRNPVYDAEFVNPSIETDWLHYRNEELNLKEFWRNEAFDYMKHSINSVLVADLPSEPSSESKPYLYFLQISDILFYHSPDQQHFDWIIFKQPDKKIAVFDDESFRVFKSNQAFSIIEGEPIIENGHDLGYCPARFFWTTPINNKERQIKKSCLTTHLAKLDDVIFYDVSNDHLNLYARYPVVSAASLSCDYENPKTGEYCERGYLRNHEGNYIRNERTLKRCPICETRRLDGAGSMIEYEPPGPQNKGADLSNPIKFHDIPRDSLDYNSEDIQQRKFEIYSAITGYKGLPINNQAVNEKQVLAIFESLESALEETQENFELAMNWADMTLCGLRYGPNAVTSITNSLGTEHFIMSPAEILSFYKLAKESNFSVATLDMIENMYYATEFRNNPMKLRKQRIVSNVDPFRHLSNDEVKSLYESGSIRYHDFMIKMNFSSFIMRFERENVSIVEFAIAQSLEFKVNKIKQVLTVYAEEMKPLPEATQ